MMDEFFFFNDTATTEIYTLSLHDALPICPCGSPGRMDGREHAGAGQRTDHDVRAGARGARRGGAAPGGRRPHARRSEEHTSELQSRQYLVCRLLLEKKKNKHRTKVTVDNV